MNIRDALTVLNNEAKHWGLSVLGHGTDDVQFYVGG